MVSRDIWDKPRECADIIQKPCKFSLYYKEEYTEIDKFIGETSLQYVL